MNFQQWHIWVITLVSFVLWMAGFLPFWTALAVFATIYVFGLIYEQLPERIRLFAVSVFVVFLVVYFVIPQASVWFRSRNPILSETGDRRAADAELKASEWQDPTALRARLGIAAYCRRLENMQGDWMTARLADLLRSVEQRDPLQATTPPVPNAKLEKNIMSWQKVIEKHRDECAAYVLQLQSKTPKVSTKSSDWDWSGWKAWVPENWRKSVQDWFVNDYRLTLWAFVTAMILALLLAIWYGNIKIASNLAALIVFAVILDWFLFAGGAKRVENAMKKRFPLHAQADVYTGPTYVPPTKPQPIFLADGTIQMPPDAEFPLGAGVEKKFHFQSLGVVFLRGSYNYVCDPVCTERDGTVSREVYQDVANWERWFGDKPCWTDSSSFSPIVRAKTATTVRARTPNDPACGK